MRATTMSRVAAALAAFTLIGGCNDYTAPPSEPSTLGGLTVVPRTATIGSGQVVELKATMRDEFGDPLTAVTIAWRSSNDAVASVSNRGDVVGRTAGHAVITASALGKTQIATIHVLSRAPKPAGKPDPKNLKPGMEPDRLRQ
jgi:uncharacterized protein YjdB